MPQLQLAKVIDSGFDHSGSYVCCVVLHMAVDCCSCHYCCPEYSVAGSIEAVAESLKRLVVVGDRSGCPCIE